MPEHVHVAFLSGVNIPGGVRLTSDQALSALQPLPPHSLRFIRFVGDVDTFLFASDATNGDTLRDSIQGALDTFHVKISAGSRAKMVLEGELGLLAGDGAAAARVRQEIRRFLATVISGEPELVWREARRVAVALVRLAFEAAGRPHGERPLHELLQELSRHSLLTRKAVAYLHTIRTVRNASEYSVGSEHFHEADIEVVTWMLWEVVAEGRRRRYW